MYHLVYLFCVKVCAVKDWSRPLYFLVGRFVTTRMKLNFQKIIQNGKESLYGNAFVQKLFNIIAFGIRYQNIELLFEFIDFGV